jgi:branched-subunit amino acid transport protein
MDDGKIDMLAIIGISLAWIAMILVVNPVGDFPLNDDWVYGGAAQSLLSGTGFRIPGPTITDIIAQAVWGAAFCIPFGFSYTALRVSTLTLGLVGLWFFHALQRENGVNPRLAWAATAALAVYPHWLDLANSFMTDVPFAALMVAALYFLVRFLRDNSWPGLLAGLLISIAAILTRQVGVAILLAFAVANALKYRWRIGPAVLGLLPLLRSGSRFISHGRGG